MTGCSFGGSNQGNSDHQGDESVPSGQSQGGGEQSTPSGQSQGGASSQEVIPAGEFTFDETALNTPQEIHTANQKQYLNLDIQYYNITEANLTSCGAKGNANNSTPNKVSVSWEHTAASGKTLSKYQLVYGQKADLSDGYTINGTTAKSISFYNPYLGDNYFKVIANYSDGSKEASEIKVFKVDTQAPRNLYVGAIPNCRDMGGRTTYAGGKIKQGMIIRTAGNRFDYNTQIDDAGRDVMLNQLKLKTEINVSDNDDYNLNLSGMQLKNVYMDYGATPYSNLSRNAEKIRNIMDILADVNNYPVSYHCRIGTDRTGITGMMIGGLLGIPFNEVFQDYCFSNFAPINGMRYPHKANDTNGDDPAKYIDEILALPGKNFQEQTYYALLSIGCQAQKLNTIIDIMTEGAKAELPTTMKVGKGSDLTTTGTTGTSSDYKNPETYYTITNGKEVSYASTFTAGEKDVVVYIGSTDASKSTNLSAGITLKIDGAEQTIANTKTYYTAGFGQTSHIKNTGYMFNLLGKYSFSAGQHTVSISVKNSTTFYIGTICVFDHVAPSA